MQTLDLLRSTRCWWEKVNNPTNSSDPTNNKVEESVMMMNLMMQQQITKKNTSKGNNYIYKWGEQKNHMDVSENRGIHFFGYSIYK